MHGFAHQAGGHVGIESELGRGTTVTLYLPPTETLCAEDSGSNCRGTRGGTVLLVEDNPDVAEASAGLFEQLGYRVRISTEAALLEIERDGIDLVFTDIVMPGKMDGLGLAKVLRATYPHLPVLLATGYSEALAGRQLDFHVLRKPYAIHELSQALSKLSPSRRNKG